MKRLIFLLVIAGLTGNVMHAQGKKPKVAKMEPVLENGYYLILKSKKGQNDTVKGKIQTNPDDFLEFYKKFGFEHSQTYSDPIIDTLQYGIFGLSYEDYIDIMKYHKEENN